MTLLRESLASPARETRLAATSHMPMIRLTKPDCSSVGPVRDDAIKFTVVAKPHEKRNEHEHLDALFGRYSFEQHFQPESTVLLHGNPVDTLYQIVSGTVRCCTINSDGVRQIFSFARKGDFIGISDIDTWHFTAEAVDHVVMKSVPRPVLEHALAVNISLREEIRGIICELLVRRERQLLSMTSKKAPERLLGFLQEFSARRASSEFVVLPMSRSDIGDHLGMTIETASRSFTDLKNRGIIEMKTPEKYRLVG